MTEPNALPQALSFLISDMEDNIYDVRRWGDVLIAWSASSHSTPPETLGLLGNALHELGLCLEEQFKGVFALSRPPT